MKIKEAWRTQSLNFRLMRRRIRRHKRRIEIIKEQTEKKGQDNKEEKDSVILNIDETLLCDEDISEEEILRLK